MLIVGQNKEKVKKYNNIITIEYDNNYKTSEEFWIIFIDGEDMAHYKTKERAKEVLKDIVLRYEAIELCKNKSADDLGYTLADYTPVYEMPEE